LGAPASNNGDGRDQENGVCVYAEEQSLMFGLSGTPPHEPAAEQSPLTRAISAEIVSLYATVYGHGRTTATTYINDNVVLCVLENILTADEHVLIDAGSGSAVIDGRIAFQTDTEDEFTAVVERLTARRVVAFMSANQTTPGVAAELFFLDAIAPSGAAVAR